MHKGKGRQGRQTTAARPWRLQRGLGTGPHAARQVAQSTDRVIHRQRAVGCKIIFFMHHLTHHVPRGDDLQPEDNQHNAGDQEGDERSPSKAATGGRSAGGDIFYQDQVSSSSSGDRGVEVERAGAEVGFIGSLSSLGSVAEQQLTPEGRQGGGRFTSGG